MATDAFIQAKTDAYHATNDDLWIFPNLNVASVPVYGEDGASDNDSNNEDKHNNNKHNNTAQKAFYYPLKQHIEAQITEELSSELGALDSYNASNKAQTESQLQSGEQEVSDKKELASNPNLDPKSNKNISGFNCVDALRKQQTIHSGLYLNAFMQKAGVTPCIKIAHAMAQDIKGLKGADAQTYDTALRVFYKVAVQAKRDFGLFSDDAIAMLARLQSDLYIKAHAFGVFDKPNWYFDLVTAVYDTLIKEGNRVFDLKACAKMVASFQRHIKNDPELKGWKDAFDYLMISMSFAQNQSSYLTKLALNADTIYLKPATTLVTHTGQAEQALTLLTHASGWLYCDQPDATKDESGNTIGDEQDDEQDNKLDSHDAFDALTGVITKYGSMDILRHLAAANVNDAIHRLMLDKLTKQVFAIKYDARLSTYLSLINTKLSAEDAKQLYGKLIMAFDSVNTLASQDSLEHLLKRNPQHTPIYKLSDVDMSIVEGKLRRFEHYKNYNVDKTLIKVTHTKVVLNSLTAGLDNKVISLAKLSNEHALKSVIDDTLAESNDPDEDYQLSIQFKPETTYLLRSLITHQISESLDDNKNELNRLLNQPVPMVVTRLDSRAHIQQRIEFDAGLLNVGTHHEADDANADSANDDNDLLAVYQRLQPTLTISVDALNSTTHTNGADKPSCADKSSCVDESSTEHVYKFCDYKSFDDLAEAMFSNLPNFDIKNDSYHLNFKSINDYIDRHIQLDIDAFMTEPTNDALCQLNQYFYYTVQAFLEAREVSSATV